MNQQQTNKLCSVYGLIKHYKEKDLNVGVFTLRQLLAIIMITLSLSHLLVNYELLLLFFFHFLSFESTMEFPH